MYTVDIEWYHGGFLVIDITIIGIFDTSCSYSPGASKPSDIFTCIYICFSSAKCLVLIK